MQEKFDILHKLEVRKGKTKLFLTIVHEDACSLALFIRLSNATLSSSLNALLNTESSITISSSSILKLGTVLPISAKASGCIDAIYPLPDMGYAR